MAAAAAAEDDDGLIRLVRFHPKHGPLPVDTPLLPKAKTRPYLQKFERSRLLMSRAAQLSLNADATVPIGSDTDAFVIAKRELKARTIPLVIRRILNQLTGEVEDWCLAEELTSRAST